MTKEALILEAMLHGLTKESKDPALAEKEFTCFECPEEKTCPFAWDLYCINGDCLAEK